MKVPEGDSFSMEELSAKRTIISGDDSSQGKDAKLVDIMVEQPGSHADSSPPEWLKNIMNEGAAQSSSAGKKQPKVPKIPKMIRDIGSEDDCYNPFVVSIGPYHHGKRDELQEIENLKIKMANQYVEETKRRFGQKKKVEEVTGNLYKKVKQVAGEAKKYYDLDSLLAIDDESFTKMIFLDGCFLLQYIYLSVCGYVRKMGMESHHPAFVSRDLFLLENQLPYIVLEALMSMRFTDGEGEYMIMEFIKLNHVTHSPPPELRWNLLLPTNNSSSSKDDQPLHLLDMMRKTFVGPNAGKALVAYPEDYRSHSHRYLSAKELKTVGIRFSSSMSGCYTDVRFSSTMRTLTLPPLSIDDSTKSMLINMAAFETCRVGPDDFWVTSYICFMNSLINDVEDVAVLRSQSILLNYLGSDQAVADLFNGIAKYLKPNPQAYVHVTNGIRAHYNSKLRIALVRCMDDWVDTYFRSPWTAIALLGAILALVLSVIQLTPHYTHRTNKNC